MIVSQLLWSGKQGWTASGGSPLPDADLVLSFGAKRFFKEPEAFEALRRRFGGARMLGCSTAGEIHGNAVHDDSLTAVAVRFEHTRIAAFLVNVGEDGDCRRTGEELAHALAGEDLAHVFVLSDGLAVNGSDLAAGLAGALPPGTPITGGLAGDAGLFEETFVMFDAAPYSRAVIGLGLYGHRLRTGCGSRGGWDPFGPERLITASKGNVLYEMDGTSALDTYKRYLGKHAEGLPATGLLFPLSIRVPGRDHRLVRTVLAVSEEDGGMTFAGDVPKDAYAQLMKANFNRLVDGAVEAAETCLAIGPAAPELAILISCVGRKMILKQMVDEEVEGVAGVFGAKTLLTGFYSYGEIAPAKPGNPSELHNQTMTITTLSEE